MSINKFRSICRSSQIFWRVFHNRTQSSFHHVRSIPIRNFATESEQNVLPNRADVKMKIQFTCNICNTRNEKYFSKTAYTHGVVIIRCDGCDKNHLIADNLNWFNDSKKNIEDILAEKGIEVKKGVIE